MCKDFFFSSYINNFIVTTKCHPDSIHAANIQTKRDINATIIFPCTFPAKTGVCVPLCAYLYHNNIKLHIKVLNKHTWMSFSYSLLAKRYK